MVRIGVIGAGKWGQNHLRVFSELGCLTALADNDKERKEIADKYNIAFFTDYKKMLPLVDAVSIVVPTNLHYGIVKGCLQSNKHVLVEKPITLSSKEAKELVELAKKKSLILAVGYLFRFNNAVKLVKNEIKKIGEVQYITARYIHSDKPPRKDCGVIFNFAIHLIDILNFILDSKPKKVFCRKKNFLSKEREDVAFIILDYGKFIANLEVSWLHPEKKRDLWIIGSKEKVYADLLNQEIKKFPIEVSHDKTIKGREIILEVEKNEPLREELKHFCDCIKNKDVTNVAEEEIATTKVCEACLLSAENEEEIIL